MEKDPNQGERSSWTETEHLLSEPKTSLSMVALRVGVKVFQRRYRSKVKALLKLAEGMPDRPSSEEVHDVRIIARRVQMMCGLLPKTLRGSENLRMFGLALKSMMKATSELRDLDTLTVTLEPLRDGISEELLVRLGNQRSDAAARSKLAISSLLETPPPDLDGPELREKRLSRRLRRRVRRHGHRAMELLPRIIEDESKVAELHSFRKEVKKLRYLLELTDGSHQELPIMTRWQDSLGAIHDLDVAVAFLERSSNELKGRKIGELRRRRHQSYLKFVSECKADAMETLAGSKILRLIPAASLR